ncbi:MAG: prolipoprotein diacylglyceryl transferase [candidate division Zixibacteria bacterium]|jgi:phosphatidylglycerol:prolipoprotein diacylglycerol transferase|nr:prolipoprotein diacylglyceryl transferase [candidate division Zixibacteria bacterium]
MLPELFRIGPFPIRMYGLMLAVSFLLGVYYVYRATQRDGKRFEPYLAIAYILIFGGIIGARLAYVLFHLEEFAGNWGAAINPFHSGSFGIAGLNLYGGVVLAIVGAFVYCRIKGLSVLEVFDYFSPTMGIGLFFTRIGCFCNGCCFGTPTDLPWGVSFPASSIPYYVFGDAHLHPAQIYSSLYGLGLFLVLHKMLKHQSFSGQVVAVLFMVEAVFRFGIEYVRYYENEMYFSIFGLDPTYNQAISISLFLLGLAIYLVQRRAARRP